LKIKYIKIYLKDLALMNPVSHALLQGASNFRDVGGYRNT